MSLGARAAIVGRDASGLAQTAAELTKATGQDCLPCPADVRDPKALERAAEECARKFGKIDFVICGEWEDLSSPLGASEVLGLVRRSCPRELTIHSTSHR